MENLNLGFCCLSKKINTKYRTLRLSNFNVPLWHEIIKHNINQTEKLIDYCIAGGYKILRLSSDIIPFATHSITDGLNWIDTYKEEFSRIGQKANKNNLHLSMHPAQYTCINSPKNDVVINAIKDLEYHNTILDLLDSNGEIVIHTGGIYNNKVEAIQRFINKYNSLPSHLQDRLVLENDDKSYTIDDVMYINSKTNIPIVFDFHHHICNYTNNSSTYSLQAIFETWNNNNTNRNPKVHISSPKNNKDYRSHADNVEYEYVKSFITDLVKHNKQINVFLECKNKDLAVNQFKIDLQKAI